MTSVPLARHRVVATTDLDEARTEFAARFCPHDLRLTERGGRLDLVHNAVPVGPDVQLHFIRYGDGVRITPGRFEDFYLVQIPLSGTAVVRIGDRAVRTDRRHASVGWPTEPVDMEWAPGCEKLVVYIRRAALEELAAPRPEDRRPVVFDPLVNLDAIAVRDWLRLVRLVVEETEGGAGLLSSPLVAHQMGQTLMAGLLAAQRNNSGCADALAGSQTTSRSVRVTCELIEGAPERPWRLADLVEHAGVSARTLQEAFQRELGMSPLEHLRRVRLDHAHAELLAADPSTASVTQVAARWGFFHLGRFSSTYRAAYGELPSQTLGR